MHKTGKAKAKMAALKDMKSVMKGKVGESIADKMPMKVTVASDTEAGLKEGLSKAEEIMKMKLGSDPSPKVASEDHKKKK